jgi:hypothetical protein
MDAPRSPLAAAGAMARVLFKTTVIPASPPLTLVGIGDTDEALGPPGLSFSDPPPPQPLQQQDPWTTGNMQ